MNLTHVGLFHSPPKLNIKLGMKYPNKLNEIRRSRGLSMDRLAEKMNTSRGQVYNLETGKRQLTQRWMYRLAEALECAPEDLLPTTKGVKYEFDDDLIKKCGDAILDVAHSRHRKLTPSELIAYTILLYRHVMEFRTAPSNENAWLILQQRVV